MQKDKIVSDEGDIIIELTNHLNSFKENEFVIGFADADEELKFAEGSTAKHIEQAIKDAGFTLVRKSSSQVRIRKAIPLSNLYGVA